MSTLPFAIASASIAGSFSWIAFSAFRTRHIDQFRQKIESNRATRLYPFVETADPCAVSDDKLWGAIGGSRGIVHMNREAGMMFFAAIAISRNFPGDADQECKEIRWAAICLWLLTLHCLGEAAMTRLVPAWPRAQARACATLYCSMFTTLDYIFSACNLSSAVNISQ